MEEADDHQYNNLMWMKRKEILMKTHFEAQPILMNSASPSSSTWEEKAFAEEYAAAGSVGGCIWPPRSYSCSFCMREFKSAQALGGHMNIHRRDRARLKQCLNISPYSHHDSNDHHHNLIDHNSDHDHHDDNRSSKSLINLDNAVNYLNPNSSNFTTTKASSRISFLSPCYNPKGGDDENDDDDVETDLCVGLNSVVSRQNKPITSQLFRNDDGDDDDDDDDDDQESNMIETAKGAAISPLEFFFKPCHIHDLLQSEVIGVNSSSNSNNIDDLDLELRLGEPPKLVK